MALVGAAALSQIVAVYVLLTAVFLTTALTFVPIGQLCGRLMERQERKLRAYGLNLLGSLLNIKPLIGVEDGEIVPLGVARSRAQAYQAMVDKIESAVGKSRIKVAYVHAGARQEVEKIKSIVDDRLDAVESIFGELSPALAVHTGPGTAGLCYFPAEVQDFSPE